MQPTIPHAHDHIHRATSPGCLLDSSVKSGIVEGINQLIFATYSGTTNIHGQRLRPSYYPRVRACQSYFKTGHDEFILLPEHVEGNYGNMSVVEKGSSRAISLFRSSSILILVSWFHLTQAACLSALLHSFTLPLVFTISTTPTTRIVVLHTDAHISHLTQDPLSKQLLL